MPSTGRPVDGTTLPGKKYEHRYRYSPATTGSTAGEYRRELNP